MGPADINLRSDPAGSISMLHQFNAVPSDQLMVAVPIGLKHGYPQPAELGSLHWLPQGTRTPTASQYAEAGDGQRPSLSGAGPRYLRRARGTLFLRDAL